MKATACIFQYTEYSQLATISKMPSPVDLDRQFSLFSNRTDTDQEALFAFSENFSSVSWDKVLEHNHAIVLAEAGSGKTDEFKMVAARLHDDGEAAFFCRIEKLLETDFDNDFDTGDIQRFDLWKINHDEGSSCAYFFLDSVDEAKLTKRSALDIALKRFVKVIGLNNLNRAKIFVSSRFSEWRAKADLEVFCKRLEVPEPVYAIDCKFIYKLKPLDDTQIKLFASHYGVEFPEDFLNAIKRSDADILAQRPQDLLDLIAYWEDHKCLGKHHEMIEYGIKRKLIEINSDRDLLASLSFNDAISGAMQLAAATTFLKKNKIRLPDPVVDKDFRCSSLDPSQVLTKLDENQKQALLTRPIFDEAIYGAVRFHHRSVREFLTAKWLNEILQNGGIRRRVESVLFTEKYGREVAIPSMQPIAAWLSCWDEKVRNRLLRIAPEVLVEYGDPSVFPLGFRIKLLTSLIKQYEEQQYTDLKIDPAVLKRLASPEMSDTINQNLQAYSSHRDLCELFLNMVWYGEVMGSIEAVIGYCLLEGANEYTRVTAFRTVLSIGSYHQKKQLIRNLLDQGEVGSSVVGYECYELFPDLLSIDDLFLVLESSPQEERYSAPNLDSHLSKIATEKALADDEILYLLEKVVELTNRQPLITEKYHGVSEQFGWILTDAVRFINQLLRSRSEKSFDNNVFTVLWRYFVFNKTEYYVAYDIEKNFLRHIKAWPDFVYKFFWFVAQESQGSDFPPSIWRQLRWNIDDLYTPLLENWEELLSEIKNRKNRNEKLIALSALWHIYTEFDKSTFKLSQLQQAVKENSGLDEVLRAWLEPEPPSESELEEAASDKLFKEKRRSRQKREQDVNNDWVRQIKSRTLELGNPIEGKVSREGIFLLNKIKKKLQEKSEHRIGGDDWTLLIDECGEKVAKKFRDACIQYWRGFDPFQWRDQTNFRYLGFGLSGLVFEFFSNLNWAKELSSDDASRASAYAVFNSDGFPDWLPDLYQAHFSEVRDVFLAEAVYELSSDFTGSYSKILQRIYFSKNFDATLLLPDLLQLVECSPIDAAQDCVQYALGILLKHNLTDEDQARLSSLATSRFSVNASRSESLLWLNVFFAVDAERGVENLEILLQHGSNGEEREAIASQFFEGLTERPYLNMHTKHTDYKRIEILEKLIPIAFKSLNPDEDIPLRNGQDLESRDYAQRSREGLLRLVAETKGAKSYVLLDSWAKDARFLNRKDWLLQQAKNRAEVDAEVSPWIEADIPKFFGDAEKTPRNEYDLFHIACGRLVELKTELEFGDDSIAQTVRRAEKETELRNWFANSLNGCSHSKYEVLQEVERPDGKKLDLSFQIPDIQPVPVELKIAEKWSYNKLLERLENQLIKQYMRTSKYGIFLLARCSFDGRKSWKGDGSYSFVELVEKLNKQALKLQLKYENIEEVRVIGIDLMLRDNY